MKNSLKKLNGFTLVEVLVAVVILVVVIGGVTALESGNIKTGTSGKFNIQANGLAQEGANIVKSLDDNNKLVPGANGGDCTDPSTCPAGVYYIDGSKLKKCYTDSTENIFQTMGNICLYPNAAQTPVNGQTFTRTVIIPN